MGTTTTTTTTTASSSSNSTTTTTTTTTTTASVNTQSSLKSGCSTVSGPSVGKQCVFPFKFQGVTYNGCAEWIYGGEHHGSTWCSTKVDANGEHLDGVSEWGICPDSCSKHNSLDFL